MSEKLLAQRQFSRAAKSLAILALTTATAMTGASLIVNNLAQAENGDPLRGADAKLLAFAPQASQPGLLIDHTPAANSKRFPEPDASLLHSEPNAYLNLNAAP